MNAPYGGELGVRRVAKATGGRLADGLGGAPRAALSRATALPLVLGVVALLPFAVAVHPGEGRRDLAFWLLLTIAVYAGARLCAMVLAPRRRLVQGAFWLFCYLAMGVAPLAQQVLARDPTPVVGPREDTVLAAVLVLLGMLAFDVGALLARHRPATRHRPRRPLRVHRGRLWLLVAFAYGASLYLVVRLGGPAEFFVSREEFGAAVEAAAGLPADEEAGEAGTAILRGLGQVPALLALLFLTRWLVTSRRARRSAGVVLAWTGLVVLNGIVNNPLSNPRFWFLTVLFSLLFTVFPRSPVLYRAALALGVVVAVLVFPFADHFRYADDTRRTAETTSVWEPLAAKDYDQMGMFANAVTFTEDGDGHSLGRQLSASVLFFVPRSVWEDKPVDAGVQVGEWMGVEMTNLSMPLWTEVWVDFGTAGLVLVFLALGYGAARADRGYAARTVDDPSPGNVLAVTVPLVAGYSFILLRGPLLQATGRVAIAALCVAAIATLRERAGQRLY